MKQKLKKASYWLSITAIGIVLGTSLQFTRAWVEPTAAPPGSNIGAPINTGTVDQIKRSGIGITGSLVVNQNAIIMGNVGVGTSAPNEKLDVLGKVHASEDVCIKDGLNSICLNDLSESISFADCTLLKSTGDNVYSTNKTDVGVPPSCLNSTCALVVGQYDASGDVYDIKMTVLTQLANTARSNKGLLSNWWAKPGSNNDGTDCVKGRNGTNEGCNTIIVASDFRIWDDDQDTTKIETDKLKWTIKDSSTLYRYDVYVCD